MNRATRPLPLMRRLTCALVAATVVTLHGCAPPIECGTGTTLDESTYQCVADITSGPDFNRVVEEVQLGHLRLSDVNVPDAIVTGTRASYSFNVQNTSTEAEAAVSMRVLLFPQTPTAVRSYVDHLATDGVGCTDTCVYANNGTCEDGVAGASTGCQAGSDCADCGARNTGESDWSCSYPTANPDGDARQSCAARYFDGPPCRNHPLEADSWQLNICSCEPDCADEGNCCADYAGFCTSAGGSCQEDEYCHPHSKQCHLEEVTIAQATLIDLPAGETKAFAYEVELPPNWTEEGNYTLAFALGEHWVVLSGEGATADPEQPALKNGEVSLHRAAAIWVDAVQIPVSVDDSGSLAVTLSADTTSIALDATPDYARPLLTANVTARALGLPVTAKTTVSFALQLPGHTLDLSTYDPAAPSGTYDAERSFALDALVIDEHDRALPADDLTLFEVCSYCFDESSGGNAAAELSELRDGLRAGTHIGPDSPLQRDVTCQAPGVCTSPSGLPTFVIQQGPVRDVSVPLVLSPADTKLLSETLNLVSANETLTANHEIAGTLVVTVSSPSASGSAELPIVFRAPEAAKPADAFDAYEPAEVAPGADEYAGDSGYPEKDNLTPTFYRSYGGEWLGADMQIFNQSSKDRRKQAVIKQAWQADNFLRANILTGTFNLLKLAGEIDFGTRRDARHNKANGVFIVPTVPSTTSLIGLFQTGELTNTLLEFDYDPTDEDDIDEACEIEDGVETCAVLTTEVFMPTTLLDDYGVSVEVSADDKSIVAEDGGIFLQMVKGEEREYPYGPILFKAGVEGALLIGVKGGLSFVRDANAAPEFASSIHAYLGPALKVKGSATGKALLGPLGIAATGSITFAELDVLPGFVLELVQDLRNEGQEDECWWRNTGAVKFQAPITFKSMSGDVKVAAIIEVDLDVVSITVTLYEHTLFEWPALINREWMLFQTVKRHGVGAGICEGAPVPGVTWKSPRGCKTPTGGDAYCPKADGRWNYTERFFTGPRAKGKIYLEGITEIGADVVRLRPGPSDIDFIAYPAASPRDEATRVSSGTDDDGPYFEVSGRLSSPDGSGPMVILYEMNRGPYGWTDAMRWIDVEMHTDNTLSASGVTARHETETGAESVFFSDDYFTWSGSSVAGSYNDLGYEGASGFPATSQGSVPGTWWNYADRPHWVGTAEQSAMKWVAGYNPIPGFTPATGWFRRPFLASGSIYVVTMFCDDNCNVFLDGGAIGSYNLSSGWESYVLNTLPGVPHLLTVQLGNDGGGTGFAVTVKDFASLTPSGCGYMPLDKKLDAGERFFSCNGAWEFVHQEDGNVVLYQTDVGPVWATGTAGQQTTELLQQLDGNLVLYGPNGALWATGTVGAANFGAYLRLGDDGSLVVTNGNATVWSR